MPSESPHGVQGGHQQRSFPSALAILAKESKHLTPKLLGEEVEKLEKEVVIYINHIKESGEDIIKQELMNIPKLKHATIVHDFQKLIF